MDYSLANEIHAKVLDILKFLDKLCKEHNWKYYLAYGTLLGAVRHNGFIPWDDDIDLWMPRKDYDELLEYLRTENKDERYVLGENHYTTDLTRPSEWLLRIFDLETEINCEASSNIKYLWLDIMPLESMHLNSQKRFLKQVNKRLAYFKFVRMKKYRYNAGGFKGFVNKAMYTLHNKYGMFKKVFDEKRELGRLMDACTQYVNDETCDGYFCHGYIYNLNAPHKCFFEKKWFEEVVEMKFEDMTCLIPKYYDEILTLVYKDYMTLPPEDKRVFHGIEIIRKEEK